MSGHSYTPPIPRLTLFFALLGLAWCAYISFPAAVQPPCATSGCELFRDGKIAGLSLWWVGGAFFFVLAILCLKGRSFLAANFLALGVLVDAALLLVMFVTAPCLDCLVFAAVLGLCLLCLLLPVHAGVPPRKKYVLLLAVWFGLFLGNSALALNEQVKPLSIATAEAPGMRLYFSPSCPACREAVKTLGDTAALYPIEENDDDFNAILRFRHLIENKGLSPAEAMAKSLDPLAETPRLSFLDASAVRLQLLRNKAAVFRQGFRALPLIEINGMPGFRPAAASGNGGTGAARPRRENPESDPLSAAESSPGGQTPLPRLGPDSHTLGPEDFLESTDILGRCSGSALQPCE